MGIDVLNSLFFNISSTKYYLIFEFTTSSGNMWVFHKNGKYKLTFSQFNLNEVKKKNQPSTNLSHKNCFAVKFLDQVTVMISE